MNEFWKEALKVTKEREASNTLTEINQTERY
jgi:hypothetical protein